MGYAALIEFYKKTDFFWRVNLSSNATPAFGDVVLHHVTNDANHVYYSIHLLGIDLSITKHIIILKMCLRTKQFLLNIFQVV